MNLAEHSYSNIYAFSDIDVPIIYGIINIVGNANATITNVTMDDVYTGTSNANLGFVTTSN